MRNIVKLDTAIQLDHIGYKPDDFQWRSCTYYAVNKALIRSNHDDGYTVIRGDLFTLDADEYVAQGQYVHAPYYSEVQQWLYKTHKLFIEVYLGIDGEFFWNIQTEYISGNEKYYSKIFQSGNEYFKEISDAYESAILKCIGYIKSK